MDTFKYYAFISYKREDERWAKWLQNKLEHYRFPTNLNGRDNLPKSIRPTFRDVTDLTAGLLAEEINSALLSSEWLIVVCSPRSAKSPWVCKEAQTFIDMGRADHIIPFVIEGVPFSKDPDAECYPEALLNLTGDFELLAANINEMGRDAAAIKVISRMFGLRFDMLWQRYEREQRRKKWMWIGVAMLIALLGLGIGVYFVKQNRIIAEQNRQLEDATKRLKDDSATMAMHLERIQNDSVILETKSDSITRQNTQILKQRNDLDSTNLELQLSYQKLADERDHVLKSNWKMMENQSLYIAEKADALTDEGAPDLAAVLALEVLPKNLQNPDRPFVLEASNALIKAYRHNERVNKTWQSTLDISPDGETILASSRGNPVQLWSASTTQLLKEFSDFTGLARLSPDGTLMVIAESSSWPWYEILIVDVQTGECLQHLGAFVNGDSPSFSPDGEQVMVYSDDGINIWDVKTGACLKNIKTATIGDAIFSPDGRHLLLDVGIEPKLIDASSGELVRTFKGHSRGPLYNSFSHNGQYIASSHYKEILVWDVETGDCITTIKTTTAINSICFSNDDLSILASSSDGFLLMYEVESGDLLYKKAFGNTDVKCALFDNSESKIVALTGNTIRIINISTNNCIKTLKGHLPYQKRYHRYRHEDICLSFSPDGNYLLSLSHSDSVRTLNTIRIWDVNKGTVIRTITTNSNSTRMRPTFSPDSKFVLAGLGNVKKWNIHTGLCVNHYYENAGTNPVYSPDGSRILLLDNSKDALNIISDRDGSLLMRLTPPPHCYMLRNHSFSPDGSLIAATSLKSVLIWDAHTGDCIKQIDPEGINLSELWFSYDGKQIIGRSSDLCLVWDVSSAKCIKKVTIKHNGRKGLTKGGFGNLVLTEEEGNVLNLWDLDMGGIRDIYSSGLGTFTFITAVAFSQDGRWMATASKDLTIKIWEVKTYESLIDQIREHFKDRLLTPEQRRSYYLE